MARRRSAGLRRPAGHGPRARTRPRRPGLGGPFRGGRMIGDGELRLVVLALLAEQPRHGYDIIKALEERSHGAYSPSPGVVYPTLTYLEEAGYVAASGRGQQEGLRDHRRRPRPSRRRTARRPTCILAAHRAGYGAKMAKARAWFYRHERRRRLRHPRRRRRGQRGAPRAEGGDRRPPRRAEGDPGGDRRDPPRGGRGDPRPRRTGGPRGLGCTAPILRVSLSPLASRAAGGVEGTAVRG